NCTGYGAGSILALPHMSCRPASTRAVGNSSERAGQHQAKTSTGAGRSASGERSDLFLTELAGRRVRFARELARPPHPPAEVEVERGDQHRAHDDRVEEDAEGDREAQFGQERGRDGREDGERAGEDEASR